MDVMMIEAQHAVQHVLNLRSPALPEPYQII